MATKIKVSGYEEGRYMEREADAVPSPGDAIETPTGVALVVWRRFDLSNGCVELRVRPLPAWPPADVPSLATVAPLGPWKEN